MRAERQNRSQSTDQRHFEFFFSFSLGIIIFDYKDHYFGLINSETTRKSSKIFLENLENEDGSTLERIHGRLNDEARTKGTNKSKGWGG